MKIAISVQNIPLFRLPRWMTYDSPHLQTRPKYTNLPHCKVATSMQTCPKYIILAPLFRVMHYEWAALTKEVCFSNQFKLLNFSALHVLPCEPCSVTWREGSAIDRRAGPQTTCSASHRGVTIWWPIYISRGFSAHPFNVKYHGIFREA